MIIHSYLLTLSRVIKKTAVNQRHAGRVKGSGILSNVFDYTSVNIV